MNRLRLQDAHNPSCPVRNVLSRIADKWSLLVLYTLQNSGTTRFNELQKLLPDISQKMLTVTLRTLEEDGFVTRKVYAVVPPKVEYSLTERAYSLLPHVNALTIWAKENMGDIMRDRASAVSS
ncbi:MAG: helix-turn-helix domain-containing protein [Rikenellaceae bacterium]